MLFPDPFNLLQICMADITGTQTGDSKSHQLIEIHHLCLGIYLVWRPWDSAAKSSVLASICASSKIRIYMKTLLAAVISTERVVMMPLDQGNIWLNTGCGMDGSWAVLLRKSWECWDKSWKERLDSTRQVCAFLCCCLPMVPSISTTP